MDQPHLQGSPRIGATASATKGPGELEDGVSMRQTTDRRVPISAARESAGENEAQSLSKRLKMHDIRPASAKKRNHRVMQDGASEKSKPSDEHVHAPKSSRERKSRRECAASRRVRSAPPRDARRNREQERMGRSVTDAEPGDKVVRLNEQAIRIAELRQDKMILYKSLEAEQEKVVALEKRLFDAEATITGLRASLSAVEATDPQMCSQTGSQWGSTALKRQKMARRKGLEASEKARLSSLQRHILELCNEHMRAFCKAVIRQYEPEEFIFYGPYLSQVAPIPKGTLCGRGRGVGLCHSRTRDSRMRRRRRFSGRRAAYSL